jgi:hypothetical protein
MDRGQEGCGRTSVLEAVAASAARSMDGSESRVWSAPTACTSVSTTRISRRSTVNRIMGSAEGDSAKDKVSSFTWF